MELGHDIYRQLVRLDETDDSKLCQDDFACSSRKIDLSRYFGFQVVSVRRLELDPKPIFEGLPSLKDLLVIGSTEDKAVRDVQQHLGELDIEKLDGRWLRSDTHLLPQAKYLHRFETGGEVFIQAASHRFSG
ncbi:uncharacterized protein PAC_04978 [Phialocephala subalpina]|uniref:Uncharacterized protein n=1 Tax=Phialocephala subalpina TaxID=576137 RepID=A0A1L7WQP2_9HELO|nr:uncharacterized protein PAC_04978 [Phialocephala subalpina]